MSDSKWYHYNLDQPNNGALAEIARRLAEIERRQATFERRLAMVEQRPVATADQARVPYGWGDEVGEAYYHKPDLTGTLEHMGAWTSTTSRIVADLTSSQTARRTLQEACLSGIFFTCAGGFLAGVGVIPWYGAPIVGATGASIALAILVIHNRTLLHKMVTSQVNRANKRRAEMRVEIASPRGGQSADFLYLNSNVTEAQMAEFARAVLAGASLTVHKWTGQGALFTRGQYDDLMSELVKMNYVRDAAGNVARSLTPQGRALMRALAEKG